MFMNLFVFQMIFCTILSVGLVSEKAEAVTHASPKMQTIQDVISYARQYRGDPTLAPAQEQERLKKLLAQTNAMLPHYVVKDELKNSIRDFVDDTLSMDLVDISEFSIIDARTTEFYGKSHDIVFLVQDKEGHVRYIVKAFENCCLLSGRFLPEISAMDLIQQMPLKGVVAIEPLAVAICHEKNTEWGLLLESVAPGKRLDQYVLALGEVKTKTTGRKQRLEVAKTAFQRMGESLAQLHTIKSAKKMPLHASIQAKYDDKLNKVLKEPFIVKELSKHFTLQQFLNHVNEVKKAAMQVPLFYTHAHGDTNLGNVFYDDETDSISFIDLFGLHQSVNIKNQPISDPIIDLVRTEDGFRKKAASLLTADEIKILLSSFYTAYKASGGTIPDERHLRFYKTYINMWRLILGSHYIDEKDPIRREFDKASFEEGIEYLKSQIVNTTKR